eukprot:11476591-Alexandrium_andersonii.AAC.1
MHLAACLARSQTVRAPSCSARQALPCLPLPLPPKFRQHGSRGSEPGAPDCGGGQANRSGDGQRRGKQDHLSA